MDITLTKIGTIKTPHTTIDNMPIQPVGAKGIEGCIELNPNFTAGLTDIEGFSHLILIYKFHKIEGHSLKVKPFMDTKTHGIFATRSPKRPSPIGMSIVSFSRVESNKLYFDGADMLNDSPLIDIKPYFRHSDSIVDAACGWLDTKEATVAETTVSDARFR